MLSAAPEGCGTSTRQPNASERTAMTTDIVYYPHAIHARRTDDQSDVMQLTNLMDVEPANNFQDITEFAAGQVGPQFTGSHLASPDNRFTTHQLQTLFVTTIAGQYYVVRDLSACNV